MRTTFENEGGGSWAPPASPPRVRHRASRALIFFVLLVMAFGWGTLVAAAWDALSDQQARGELGDGQTARLRQICRVDPSGSRVKKSEMAGAIF